MVSVSSGEVVRADHTLALLTLKPGLFTGVGRDQVGRVWLDDLGMAQAWSEPTARLVGPPERTVRLHQQHKGSFGDVLVLGGAPGMAGAAQLAATAALAAPPATGMVHNRPSRSNSASTCPAPTPMITRPPEMASIVANDFATWSGCR